MAIQIALGATIQIALLVAPILVIASYMMGNPMDLVIHRPLELVGLFGATLITASVARDGETNWLEGAMLLGVYLLLALAFCTKPGFATSATKAAVRIVHPAVGSFIALPYVRQRRLGKPLPSHVRKEALGFENQKFSFQISA